jgi:NADP-dependent 3-hydroxy acid dehydrogenase YdfG
MPNNLMPEDQPLLTGQVAIITGASSGIGLACAQALLAAGVRVVAAGQRPDRLAALARAHPEGQVATLAGDITNPAHIDALFAHALVTFGRLDIVVNNAGYMVSGPVADLDLDQVARMVRINVEAAFRVMHRAVRHFLSAGGGALVSTSSSLGRKTALHAGAYAGTKHALEALAEALRMEVAGLPIRITNLRPGLVATELHRDYAVPMARQRGIDTPLAPEDVARALIFVLSQPAHVRIPELLIQPAQAVA